MKSCKIKFNGESQVTLEDLKALIYDSNKILTLSSLQFTRTKDNNVKIQTIIKEIKNNFYKRKMAPDINQSFMWSSNEEYQIYNESLKKVIKKSKPNKIEQNLRKYIDDECIYIKNQLEMTLEDLIYLFEFHREAKRDIKKDSHLFYKNELLKKCENFLKKCNRWFIWFLVTNIWIYDPYDFYYNNNLFASPIEFFWREELISLNIL